MHTDDRQTRLRLLHILCGMLWLCIMHPPLTQETVLYDVTGDISWMHNPSDICTQSVILMEDVREKEAQLRCCPRRYRIINESLHTDCIAKYAVSFVREPHEPPEPADA